MCHILDCPNISHDRYTSYASILFRRGLIPDSTPPPEFIPFRRGFVPHSTPPGVLKTRLDVDNDLYHATRGLPCCLVVTLTQTKPLISALVRFFFPLRFSLTD